MSSPKTVRHSQGALHDPRIPGAVQSPAGSPTFFTNIGCAFSMCFPVSTTTPCGVGLNSYDTTLRSFSFSSPIDRDDTTYVNGPLIIEGAAMQYLTDITTTTNKPKVYEIDVMWDSGTPRSLVGSPNYGTDGEDMFDNVTFDITTNWSTGTDNAIIGPGIDTTNTSAGTKASAWSSDAGLISTSAFRFYVARNTSSLFLRITTQRASGSANVLLDLNVFIWGVMLPPLRNP